MIGNFYFMSMLFGFILYFALPRHCIYSHDTLYDSFYAYSCQVRCPPTRCLYPTGVTDNILVSTCHKLPETEIIAAPP